MDSNAEKYGMKRESGLQIIMEVNITKQSFFHSKVDRKPVFLSKIRGI